MAVKQMKFDTDARAEIAAGLSQLARAVKAAEIAADAITAQAKKVKGREDYKRVATISANGDEKIGDLMADAMDKVGKEGVITVDEGKATESVLEYHEGMQFDKGFLSPYF